MSQARYKYIDDMWYSIRLKMNMLNFSLVAADLENSARGPGKVRESLKFMYTTE